MTNGITRRSVILSAAAAFGTALPVKAQGATIKLGELNSYNRYSANTLPARYGWQLARDEINAKGGVLGQALDIVSLDDGSTPTDALRAAEQLVSREKVVGLFGGWQSNVAVAVGDFANRQKLAYLATYPIADSLTMENGNPFTFRLRPSLHMQIGMLEEDIRRTGAKRWAIVAPNYEFGHSAADGFKRLLGERVPEASIVVEQYPVLGKVDAGAVANALEGAQPDGIFSALFSADLAQFARDGQSRGLFDNRTVLSLATGEPETLRGLGADTPEGWIVTGYPSDQIVSPPAHKAFIDTYTARFKELPTSNSLLSYTSVYLFKAAIEKAGSLDPQAIGKALSGLTFDSVAGPIAIRALDGQATLGYWIGKTAVRGGKPMMTDWRYVDGAQYLYTDAQVAAARKR